MNLSLKYTSLFLFLLFNPSPPCYVCNCFIIACLQLELPMIHPSHCQNQSSKTQIKAQKCPAENPAMILHPFKIKFVLDILYYKQPHVPAMGNYMQEFQTQYTWKGIHSFFKLKNTLQPRFSNSEMLPQKGKTLVAIFNSSFFLILTSQMHLIFFIPKVIIPSPTTIHLSSGRVS